MEKNISFVNLTPHAIKLNSGVEIPASGELARVSSTTSEFDALGIATQSWGAVSGIPEPKQGTIYIVSALVLGRVKNRPDVVAPATGHKDCVRDERGFIVSVPGFIRNED